MVFSSAIFLFYFLPLALPLYFMGGKTWRNALLVIASLFFYAWGEGIYILVLCASITFNFTLGLLLERLRGRPQAKWAMAAAIVGNLGLLGVFKYAGFLVANVNTLLAWLHLPSLAPPTMHLPLGISFFSFHAMSYVIDVYRGEVPAQRNPLRFALYISFFPQSIAGPIVRYSDVAGQLRKRTITAESFAAGIQRFILGLSKKVLIANTVAVAADAVFQLQAAELTTGLAWLGALCYTLQIYFDFSGYSDMAIGLALMFGFRFKENFNYPYAAQSVTDFWRRWHISLSTWFRDYLYIPLGGNRCGKTRHCLNLLTIFFLCGLWHGASWTFVLWGLYHGALLSLERLAGNRNKPAFAPLRWAVTLVAVMVGWVFFRADSLSSAGLLLKAMAGFAGGTSAPLTALPFWSKELLIAIFAGVIGALPILPLGIKVRDQLMARASGRQGLGWLLRPIVAVLPLAALTVLFWMAAAHLARGTHNPFIYFRF